MRSKCDWPLVLLSVFASMASAGAAKAGHVQLAQSGKDSYFIEDGKRASHRNKKDSAVAQVKEDESANTDPNQATPPDAHPRPGLHGGPPDGRFGGRFRQNGSGRSWDRFGPGPLDLSALNLTPEQKQKIQEIRKETGNKARDLRKTLRSKRLEMRDLMFDPDVSEAELRKKHKQVASLHEQAENAMFEDFLSIRSLLTPVQKKHLPEIKPALREGPPRHDMGRPDFGGPPRAEGGRPGPGEAPGVEQ